MDRQIAPLALKQLAKWQNLASAWSLVLEKRMTEDGHRLGAGVEQWHLVCAMCGQTITVLLSDQLSYLVNIRMFLDDTTRHVRNVHREMEAHVYGKQ